MPKISYLKWIEKILENRSVFQKAQGVAIKQKSKTSVGRQDINTFSCEESITCEESMTMKFGFT